VASIKVTDKKGNFLINFEKRFSKTKYSSNDYKGDTFRDNAFIKYDPITFKTFKY
jgi:hypothetical protein